jgi:hypothetical protein
LTVQNSYNATLHLFFDELPHLHPLLPENLHHINPAGQAADINGGGAAKRILLTFMLFFIIFEIYKALTFKPFCRFIPIKNTI